jgi:dolichyl-phosphate-mannose-protein mannosyltransferase
MPLLSGIDRAASARLVYVDFGCNPAVRACASHVRSTFDQTNHVNACGACVPPLDYARRPMKWLGTRSGIVAAAVAAKIALQLAALTAYGWFRDELYYLACANHLAWGYVDHPPLSIVLLRAWTRVAGDSLTAVRVLPALVGAAVVAVTALLVRELGGGRLATLIACLAMVFAPARLGFDHYYSMNCWDALFWVAGALAALRAVRDSRLGTWAACGAVLGLGVLGKWSVLWLGLGIAVGLLAGPWRRLLGTAAPYFGVLVALAVAAPNFVWQQSHGWPTLEFMRNALANKYVRTSVWALFLDVVLSMNPAAAPVWIAGIIAPFFRRDDRGRLLAAAFVTTVAIVSATRGKPEYVFAAVPLVLAPGAVVAESWLVARARPLQRALVGAYAVCVVAVGVVVLPFAVPVLPAERFIAYQSALGMTPRSSEKKELGPLPQFYADMHGWPQLVDAAAQAWATLEPAEKEDATIWAVTGGYGAAAAIDVLGTKRGLPHAISGHNSYWTWGFGSPRPRAVVLLGFHERLADLFASLTLITTVECGYCMPYENHKPVYVARGMRRAFPEFWDLVKRFE